MSNLLSFRSAYRPYMKSQRSEKELNDIVDGLITNSRELSAALQYYKIEDAEDKSNELHKTIFNINFLIICVMVF